MGLVYSPKNSFDFLLPVKLRNFGNFLEMNYSYDDESGNCHAIFKHCHIKISPAFNYKFEKNLLLNMTYKIFLFTQQNN